MTESMTRKEPAEFCFEMYACLLTYARCFERDPLLAKDMGRLSSNDDPAVVFDRGTFNPYKYGERHIVERRLAAAERATKIEDVVIFKVHRLEVMKHLEAQYQKIAAAYHTMKDFMDWDVTGMREKWQKFELLDDAILASYLIRVEDYTKLLQSEITSETRNAIRQLRGWFEERYAYLPRETQIKKANSAFNWGEIDSCIDSCFEAVADMAKQYMKMRGARKAVFKWDWKDAESMYEYEYWRSRKIDEVNHGSLHVDDIWQEGVRRDY